MPRSPTSGKDIDAIARRLSETDFTSPAATWALLSSDYPQLGSNRLAALREALEVAINTSSDTAKTDFPLTPRVLQGLAYGAGSALSTGDGGDVPGLATRRGAAAVRRRVRALRPARDRAPHLRPDAARRAACIRPPAAAGRRAAIRRGAAGRRGGRRRRRRGSGEEPDGDDAYDDYASAAPLSRRHRSARGGSSGGGEAN